MTETDLDRSAEVWLNERAEFVTQRNVAIENWHRPLKAYMQTLLAEGLNLADFDEPAPAGYPPEDVAKADRYRRVPYFLIMEWIKPGDQYVP